MPVELLREIYEEILAGHSVDLSKYLPVQSPLFTAAA